MLEDGAHKYLTVKSDSLLFVQPCKSTFEQNRVLAAHFSFETGATASVSNCASVLGIAKNVCGMSGGLDCGGCWCGACA